MIKKFLVVSVLSLIAFVVCNAATEVMKVDTKTHAVQKPQPAAGAAADLDFSGLTVLGIGGGGGGGSPPGGVTAQMQFNNSGSFGGVPYMTFDGTTIQIRTGPRLTLADATDASKKIQLDLSGLTALRTLSVPNANSVTVVAATAPSNQFATSITAAGALTFAQPSFSNLAGTLALAQTSMGTGKILGRSTAGTGAIEEITVGANLTLSGGTLSATGGGGTPGGSNTQFQFNSSSTFGGVSYLTYNGTAVVQQTGTRFRLADPTDTTKQLAIDISPIGTGTTRTVKVPNTDAVWVAPDAGASNNFLTGITTAGAVTKAQPSFTNLSGSIATSQQNIPIGANIYVDAVNGNDGTGARGRLDKPFLTVPAAVAVATSGDAIYVGPGTFTLTPSTPLVVPANVALYGSGAPTTKLSGSISGTTRAVVEPGSAGTIISDCMIENLSTGMAFGVGTSSTAFTDATLSGVIVSGVNYGIYINKSGTTGLFVYNSRIDSQQFGIDVETAGVHEIRDTSIIVDGTSTVAAVGIKANGGTIKFVNGPISAQNSTTLNIGVDAANSGTAVEVKNATLTRNATGTTNFDIRQASSSTVSVANVVRNDYAVLTNSGTVTDVSGYFVNRMSTGKLLGRSTAATGVVEEITVGTNLTLSGGTLSATGGAAGNPGGADTQVQFNDGGSFNGDSDFTWSKTTNDLILTDGPAANTPGAGITLQDTVPATSNNQQYSPALHFTGQGWKTTSVAASQSTDARLYLRPIQGTLNPSTQLVLETQINGGGWGRKAAWFSSGGAIVGNDTADPGTGVLDATTGLKIAGAAPSGHVPRGNGTNYVDAVLAATDLSMTTDTKLLGRSTAGAGAVEELTVGTGLTLAGGTLSTTGGGGAVAGSDTQIQFNDGGAFGADSGLTWSKTSDILTVTTAPAANTIVDNVLLQDTTVASNNNQQYSPSLRFSGQGWRTSAPAASQPVDFRFFLQPTQGTANPSGFLQLSGLVNNVGQTNAKFRWYMSGGAIIGTDGTDPGAGILDVTTGLKIGNAAPLGHVPRGDGTKYVDGIVDQLNMGSGIVKTNASGTVSAAVADTDYQLPLITAAGVLLTPGASFDTIGLDRAIDLLWATTQTTTLTNATTSAADPIINLNHASSGSPANNFGGAIKFGLQSSTTAGREAGDIAVQWSDVTDASRTAYMDFLLVNSAAAAASKMRLFPSGGLAVNGTTDPGAGYVDAATGYKVAGTALPISGGTTGQVLTKVSNTSYDWSWSTPSGGSVDNSAWAASWNGVGTVAPSKNAVYDWGHTFDTDDDGKVNVLDIGAGIPKTDSSGVVSVATAKTDYWDTTDFVASGGSHAHGLVPDPGASAGTTKFLREDATWATPSGGSGTVTSIATTSPVTGGTITTTGTLSLDTSVDFAFTGAQGITLNNGTTNAIDDLLTLSHDSTGSVANAFGAGILLRLEDSTTADQNAAEIATAWSDVTHATHASYLTIRLSTGGAALAGVARFWGSGGMSLNNTTDPGAGIMSANTGYIVGTSAPTSGKILKSDGAAYKSSTETYAAPSTAGNIMTSDGTNWTSSATNVSAGGQSTSGTATTTVADLAAAANTQIINWSVVATQTTTASTQFKVIITYSDSTNTNATSTANSANTLFGNAAGLMLHNSATFVANSAKAVTDIRVETAGVGTGTRTAIINGLQVPR